MMPKYLTLVALALILTGPLISIALPTQPNISSPQVVSSIPYFQHLEYIISVLNETKVLNTTKIIIIANYTAAYNVLSANNGIITVNVNITPIFETKNFTFRLLNSGNYSVNLLEDFLDLKYPYVYNGYLFKSAYQIVFAHSSIYISYINTTKVNINGLNYTAYEYFNYSSFIPSTQRFYVLSNGIGYLFNTTYEYHIGNKTSYSLTVNFRLINLSKEENVTLQGAPDAFINNAKKPYQYVLYEYSDLSKSLKPVTYIQVYYPIIFGNGYLVGEQFQLSFYSGQPVNQNFGFSLNIGNYTTLPLTFTLNLNSSSIIWGGQIFNKVGTTTLNVFGINYTVIEYKNVTADRKSFTLLYFDTNGILIKRAQGTLNQTTSEIIYTPYLIPLNSTYMSYIHYVTTGSLPYTVIAPSYSLAITVIITLVIVAIIVLLYKR